MALPKFMTKGAIKKAGAHLGRKGLSKRVLEITEELVKAPSYKEAITVAGRMKALAIAAEYDHYWDEKMTKGFIAECERLEWNLTDTLLEE